VVLPRVVAGRVRRPLGAPPGRRRTARLATGPALEDVGLHYGPLKAQCEQVVEELFPERSTITRCPIIVGANDPTHRFVYWIARSALGGTMLAPGHRTQTVQFIDARDLATWLLQSAEQGAGGAFNVAGPLEPLTMEQFLSICGDVTGSLVRLEWRDDEFLLAQALAPYFVPPMWVPMTGPMAGLADVDSSKAIAAGLRFRSPTETVRDTHKWWLQNASYEPLAWPRTEEERVLRA
jgi:2'-hydroxyisoflavone reductase